MCLFAAAADTDGHPEGCISGERAHLDGLPILRNTYVHGCVGSTVYADHMQITLEFENAHMNPPDEQRR